MSLIKKTIKEDLVIHDVANKVMNTNYIKSFNIFGICVYKNVYNLTSAFSKDKGHSPKSIGFTEKD